MEKKEKICENCRWYTTDTVFEECVLFKKKINNLGGQGFAKYCLYFEED